MLINILTQNLLSIILERAYFKMFKYIKIVIYFVDYYGIKQFPRLSSRASFVMTDAGYRHPNEITVPYRSAPYAVHLARALHEVIAGAWENQMWERVGGQN